MKVIRVLMVLDLVSTYGRHVLNGGYRCSLDGAPVEIERVDGRELRDILTQGEFDAVVAQISTEAQAATMGALRVPVVNVSNRYLGLPFPQVVSDDYEVGRAALGHFADLGHRRVAFIGYGGHQYSMERKTGFCDAAKRQGLEVLEAEVGASESAIETIARFTEQLRDMEKPVGLLACNDLCARRVVNGCLEAGLRVPEDVAVLGVDNDELVCESVLPALSSVVLAMESVGREAVRTVLEMVAGRPVPRRQLLRHRGIMVRQSSGGLAVADAEIRQAVAYVQSEMHQGLHVRDLVTRSNLSRRSFELRFKKALGVAPNDYIRQEQIARAKQLLTSGKETVKQVALRCGFADPKQFHKAFRRLTGQTPAAYRDAAQADERHGAQAELEDGKPLSVGTGGEDRSRHLDERVTETRQGAVMPR